MDTNLTDVNPDYIPESAESFVFISKSDLRGGAAIVTFRLVETLRKLGYDARMLVCEKLSDANFVEVCAPSYKIKAAFLKERLKIFLKNGRNRDTLFKIDTASDGLKLCNHPLVKNADAIFLGWVNQGMLSLKGVRRICGLGKPVVWIMHDMWNMTGVCHHAGNCTGYLHSCGDCPLLGIYAKENDISHQTWQRKEYSYHSTNIKFVAVSSWLAAKARISSLMRDLDVEIIPNAFEIEAEEENADEQLPEISDERPVKIIFGGARLDDPIKGLPVLKKALIIIRDRYPLIAKDMELITFGQFKLPESDDGFALSHHHLGVLNGNEAVRNAYKGCGIVVSSSDYETLPGTLIEGQAYGCIPVALSHGGQGDIIDHLLTGYLADWHDNPSIRAEALANGIVWAYNKIKSPDISNFKKAMRESVVKKFSAIKIAQRIINLVQNELNKNNREK